MSKFEGKILGIGNPLLDISADNVKQDVLDKYEVKLDSAILAEEKHQPLYEELVRDYQVQYIGGGATQNSMRVAQWMLTGAYSKPGMVAYMGSVGVDAYEQQLEACAQQDGICVHYMKDKTTPTGTCAVLVQGGERSLIANLAAANNFKPSHLDTDKAKEIIASMDIYYSSGFFLTVSVDALQQVADHCVTNNKIVCLNLAAPFIVEFFSAQLATALEYADYVFGNESEAASYGKKHQLGDDLTKVALAVAALPKKNTARPRIVVFTQGSSSTIVATEGKVQEFAVETLPKELLVDTNGAGDAFVGGFLAQLHLGKSLEDSVKAGHWAARYIIQQSGTTLPGTCEYKA